MYQKVLIIKTQTMKHVLKITCILAFMFGFSGYAQIHDEEAKLIQEAFGVEKKDMLMMYMALPDDDASAFWPIYDAYTDERNKLGMERYQILKDYADSYDNLSADQADDLTMRLFKNNMAIEKLQMKYYNKMKKAVSPLEASKFIQVEKYIESTMRVRLQNNIPLIGEAEQMKG